MVQRLISPRLIDIVEAIERVHAILSIATLEAFEGSWEKRWLVERGLEILSEASRHLPDELKERNPEIPWRKVAGIGNVIRHNYEHIAADVLWKLALEDLPRSNGFAARNSPLRSRRNKAVTDSERSFAVMRGPTPIRSPARRGW
jgi:uncharacterized protein with HEPN domain